MFERTKILGWLRWRRVFAGLVCAGAFGVLCVIGGCPSSDSGSGGGAGDAAVDVGECTTAGAGCGIAAGGAKCVGGECRERRCNDGKDNDEDGKVDCRDPDCTGRLCNQVSNRQITCPPPRVLSQPENNCNGIDNDCDGEKDEGVTIPCGMQEGVCAGTSVSCRGDVTNPVCDAEDYPDDYEVVESTCDGKDNDCDGAVDDFVSVECNSFDLVSTSSRAVIHDVAKAKNGTVYYVVGETDGEIRGTSGYNGTTDGFVAKYKDGKRVWLSYVGTDLFDTVHGVAIRSGEVFVAGSTKGPLDDETINVNPEAFIAKFEAMGDGALIDVEEIGTRTRDSGRDVSVNQSHVILVGGTNGKLAEGARVTGADYFVAWFDHELRFDSAIQSNVPSAERALAVESLGTRAFVAGDSSGALGSGTFKGGLSDGFVARVDRAGVDWVRMVGSSKRDAAQAVAVDGFDKHVYVGGWAEASVNGESHVDGKDGFVRSFDTEGNRRWVEMLGSNANDEINSLRWNQTAERLFVGGRAGGPIGSSTHVGNADALVVVYDGSGNRDSLRLFGTEANDAAHAAMRFDADRWLVAGETGGSIGNTTSYGGGERDGFIGILWR